MAAKRLQEHPEVMRRVQATQKALDVLAKDLGLSKPARNPRAKRSPFVGIPGKRFTAYQREFLATLARLTKELGYPPSAAEVGKHVGLSRLGARRMLTTLEEHGLCADIPKVVRSGQWALTAEGEAALLDE